MTMETSNNLPCSSVPDTSKSCNRKTTDSVVTRHLDILESLWKNNKHDQNTMTEFLHQCFSTVENCYRHALHLMYNAFDFQRTTTNRLAFVIMAVFEQWIKNKQLNALLTQDLRMEAFRIVIKQRNLLLTETVFKIFHLSENLSFIKENIAFLLKCHKYDEAAICVTTMKLQREYSLEQIVIPLFLLNKSFLVETYLKDCPDMQQELIHYLDSLCAKKTSDVMNQIAKLNIRGIRGDRMRPKTISKSMAKLAKSFDIPLDKCPNLCERRRYGFLTHLIYKKYIEKSIARDSWDEMIQSTVNSSPELQGELVQQLISFNETKEALKWAMHYNIPLNELPSGVRDELEGQKLLQSEQVDSHLASHENAGTMEESWDETDNSISYLSFRLSTSDIIFVDSVKNFEQCIQEISQNYDVVGIDAEWKPSFGVGETKLSILQLATWDMAFLLDCITLRECLQIEHWESLSKNIFANPYLLKLGYGFSGDFQMLEKNIPGAKHHLKVERMVDFSHFIEKLQKCHPELLKSDEGTSLQSKPKDCRGLSELTWMILGSCLDKKEQFSDWERRPLRESQMIYAALDAYCLLHIYETLYVRAQKINLDFDRIITEISKDEKVHKTKPSRSRTRNKPIPVLPQSQKASTSTSNIRFVVDTMLQGLGKNLRMYGIDVVILEDTDDHCEAAKIAQKEDRIILTSGTPYVMLQKYVPEGMCFEMNAGLTAKQQTALVCKHFGLKIKEEDIFSRCVVCNGDRYIKIPVEDFKQMWMKRCSSLNDKEKMNNLNQCEENSPKTKAKYRDKPLSDSVVQFDGGSVNTRNAVMDSGVAIYLSAVSSYVFDHVDLFYVCAACGKVYWLGSHFARVKQASSHLLTEESQTLLPA